MRGRRGRDCMVVGFKTTYANGAYHHWCCEFEYRSGRGVQYYVIKFVNDLRQVVGFSPSTPVSSTNKTDYHDITEILLKVVLNTIKPTKTNIFQYSIRRSHKTCVNVYYWWTSIEFGYRYETSEKYFTITVQFGLFLIRGQNKLDISRQVV